MNVTRIHNEIEILAPPEAVWETFIEFDTYGIWNPFIRRVAAPVLRPGEKVEAFLQPSGQRGMRIWPRISLLRPLQELRWRSALIHPWLLYGEHFFLVRATRTGALFIQILKFGGLLAPLVIAVIYSDTLRGIEEMNAALKIRVERFENSRSQLRARRTIEPNT